MSTQPELKTLALHLKAPELMKNRPVGRYTAEEVEAVKRHYADLHERMQPSFEALKRSYPAFTVNEKQPQPTMFVEVPAEHVADILAIFKVHPLLTMAHVVEGHVETAAQETQQQ